MRSRGVYLAKSGEIWDAFYCPGCSGNQWRLQKINNGGATTAPAAFTLPFVDVYSGNDQQHFAYLATDGEIWDAFYCPGCSGNPWRSQQIELPPISPTPSGFSASPIVVNGTVFIGDNDGYFYAIDAATGFPRWQFLAAIRRCSEGIRGGEMESTRVQPIGIALRTGR